MLGGARSDVGFMFRSFSSRRRLNAFRFGGNTGILSTIHIGWYWEHPSRGALLVVEFSRYYKTRRVLGWWKGYIGTWHGYRCPPRFSLFTGLTFV